MNNWVSETIYASGYWGILLLMFVENIFPPIPSELIMPLAGYVVSQQELSMIGVVLAGMAGSVLGALPLYYVGYFVGEERLRHFVDRHGYWLALSTKDIDTAKRWFDRHGKKTVFFCRLVPGIRSLISIPAGLACMRMPTFLLLTMLGTAIWAALLAYLGLILGQNFEQVEHYLGPVSKLVIGALVLAYVVRVFRYRRQHKSRR